MHDTMTPGPTPSVKPWTVARDTFGCLSIWDAEGIMIAVIHEDEWDEHIVSEHARLIAAAPDLLAACQGLDDAFDEGIIEMPEKDHERVCALFKDVALAIAKAI